MHALEITLFLTLFAVSQCLKLVELSPIKSKGVYQTSNGKSYPAFYLSRRGRLEVIEADAKDVFTLCDVVPVVTNVGASIVGRDDGVYDNIPYMWTGNRMAKKNFYDAIFQRQRNLDQQYDIFQDELIKCLDITITGLILEENDVYADKSITLGASIVLSRTKHQQDYKLSKSNPNLPNKQAMEEEKACVINCQLDELIGFSEALDLPIYMRKPLFESLSIDACLTNELINGKTEMKITAPLAGSPSIKSNSELFKNDNVPLAWEIRDPKLFLKLSPVQKREILRASGQTNIPRPRLGEQALDEALLNLMDTAVRGEVLRLQGKSDQDIRDIQDFNSNRQVLLQKVADALEQGDWEKAEKLREEFEMLTLLRADPTQEKGEYDPYLDQDDWYMEQRRRAMGPKKK